MNIKELCIESHKIAVEKGFWTDELASTPIKPINYQRNDGELIALMHSELSEALEALRHNNPQSNKITEFSSLEEEMADLMIRIGDYCEAKKLRIEEAIKAKMEYNKSRPYKHNKKF